MVYGGTGAAKYEPPHFWKLKTFYMTLNEQIKQANERAKEIMLANPDITNLWFQFKNIPVSEIEERSKEVERDYTVVNREEKDVLQLQCHDRYNSNVTMFAYSKPVKLTKPEFVLET